MFVTIIDKDLFLKHSYLESIFLHMNKVNFALCHRLVCCIIPQCLRERSSVIRTGYEKNNRQIHAQCTSTSQIAATSTDPLITVLTSLWLQFCQLRTAISIKLFKIELSSSAKVNTFNCCRNGPLSRNGPLNELLCQLNFFQRN